MTAPTGHMRYPDGRKCALLCRTAVFDFAATGLRALPN